MAEDWQRGGFGLYIHWPFCEAKCPYCDFNSHVSRLIDHDAWRRAYIEELNRAADETQGRVLQTVFFGGGTPSLMKPGTVSAILETVSDKWTLANNLEVTLEANPSSVESSTFSSFAEAGVNRVSLGVQSLDDVALKRLGRLHSVSEARTALDVAQSTFDRVSIDLMYGLQHQSASDWETQLREALGFGLDHVSLYQLTVEDGTAFGDRYAAGKLAGLPSEDLGADLYDLTQDLCEEHGLDAYEVSNHAKPGQASRHNLVYWRAGDYVGIGPGAHGRLTLNGTRYATVHQTHPKTWLSGTREAERTPLSRQEHAREMLLMGLRLSEGIDLDRYQRLAEKELPATALNEMVEEGYLTLENGTVSTTRTGRMLLNAVLARLA